MRIQLIILFLTCSLLHVCANTSAQSVTIDFKNADVVQVFNAIEKQTGYSFMYNLANVTGENKVTVSITLKNATIKDALDACVKGTPLTYKIINDAVVISRKAENIISGPVRQNITGKVTDQKTGNPLPGVTVRVKGTNTGTVTDAAGNYSIDADLNAVLVFTFVGYRTFDIKINGQTQIDITMVENEAMLNETVIKGYYTTTKELNTGNVSEIKSEQISRQPIIDPLAALQGQIPGLFVQQTSGAPGRQFTVRLRGYNSIANSNDPLYVVDGVPFTSEVLNRGWVPFGAGAATNPLASISPSDIESIQVLKDADATAIYGSRGANGVILINTKKGRTGKPKLDINYSSGAGDVARKRKLLTTDEYLTMRRQAFKNDNAVVGSSDYDLNGAWSTSRFTDWQEVLIGGSAKVNNLQVSLSGGNKNTIFRISGGFQKEGTVYPGDFSAQRINGLSSFSYQSDDNKLKFDFSGSYTSGINRLPSTEMAQYIFLAPNAPDIYDSAGNLNWQNNTWSNPFAQILSRNREDSNTLNTSSSLLYEFIPGLRLKASFGFNQLNFDQSNKLPATAFNTSGLTSDQISQTRSYYFANNKIRTYIIEPQITYNKHLFAGTFDGLVGITYQETNQAILTQTANGFGSDDALENLLAANSTTIRENPITKYRYNAIYARIGYTYNEKYVLNFTGRRDGSSRFGPGKQFGNFGSVGAAWLFGKESFFKRSMNIISSGKLRMSYGSTGNDKIGDYQYLSTYTSYPYTYQGVSSLYPTQHTNPYFAWERVNKFEVGLDLSFFSNKIELNTDFYRNRTKNQLVGYSLPDITGFRTVLANLPAILDNTGLEIALSGSVIDRNRWNWFSSINLSFPNSKLVSYPNLEGSSYSSRYVIGMPLDVRQYYKFLGVDPQSNLYTFQDVNSDGNISFPQDLKPTRVGQKFFGGWTNSVSYKKIKLDVLLSFAKQTGVIIMINGFPGTFNNGQGNQPKGVIAGDYLQPFSQSFSSAATTQMFSYLSSDAIVSDASYLRIRNVSLSYSVFEKNEIIDALRLYIQGQNLFTFSRFKGLDPETAGLGGLSVLPPLRVFSIGAQLTF